jgi:hypothetical protein
MTIAKRSEVRVICDLKDGDKSMQKDMNTKVHSSLKQCLHHLCYTQKSDTFIKHSAVIRLKGLVKINENEDHANAVLKMNKL